MSTLNCTLLKQLQQGYLLRPGKPIQHFTQHFMPDDVQSTIPFTLLRFCTETESKVSVVVKLFTLLRTKRTKTGIFENALRNGHFFIRFCQQFEHTKTDIFISVFVQKWSSVNGLQISAKADKFGNGAV